MGRGITPQFVEMRISESYIAARGDDGRIYLWSRYMKDANKVPQWQRLPDQYVDLGEPE